MGLLGLVESRPAAAPPPDPRFVSERFWERFKRETLADIDAHIRKVLDDYDRQFSLLEPCEAPPAPIPAKETPALGAVLSPSQVKTYLDCSARWWFRYGRGLPDPPSGSLVRGRAVHRLAELYYRGKLAGDAPDPDNLAEPFDWIWDEECEGAAFAPGDDVDELKRQAAVLGRKYLDEVAPHIEPAAVELPVSGEIAGAAVRGIVDVLDTQGRIIDLKTASRTPSGIAPDYALQLATYRRLAPGASGEARLDTVVANKTPKLVTMTYTVTAADEALVDRLYPHVREGIREGLYYPNRMSNLCSQRTCNFWAACQSEFGGHVKGAGE